MKKRLYLDTSVFGGCFDSRVTNSSRKIFDALEKGKFSLVISDFVVYELIVAPENIRLLWANLPEENVEYVKMTKEVSLLREEYLKTGILNRLSFYDASHVAAATFSLSDAIVSWNFKHIVNYDKIKAYNQVNKRLGYKEISIISPLGVIFDEE